MPSNFHTPFVELDYEFCKSFNNLDITAGTLCTMQKQRTVGFQRSHSVCPGTLVKKFNSGSIETLNKSSCWSQLYVSPNWNHDQYQLPRSSISQIPFRVDRSMSMIESSLRSSSLSETAQSVSPSLPPSDFSASTSSLSSTRSQVCSSPIPTRYKTELCRTYEESGTCKYEAKCQFAHGIEELRGLSRHPKYKTEPCRTFHTIGFCPYGARCHFIHNADEHVRERPLLLQPTLSFAAVPSQAPAAFQTMPKPVTSSRASLVSPLPSSGCHNLLSPLFSELCNLKAQKQGSLLCSDPYGSHLVNPGFTTITDSKSYKNCAWKASVRNHITSPITVKSLSAPQRSMSADSLSDQDGYTSSSSLSGSESPGIEGKRLPIFSRLSVSDD